MGPGDPQIDLWTALVAQGPNGEGVAQDVAFLSSPLVVQVTTAS